MKLDLIHDATLEAMGRYMTRLSKRQEIVASNIANIDTPGYRTKDVSFHATMQEFLADGVAPLKASQPEHMVRREWSYMPLGPEVFEVTGLPMRSDRNNVDLDREMLKLSETSFGYSLVTQLLRAKFRTIASSINEGRIGG